MRDRLLATMMVALATVCPAVAQNYTWTGSGGNGNWSTSGNWDNGTPASASNTIINLSGTTQTTTNQNITSPFILNQLNMLVDATNGFVVNGGQLQFTGTNPQITNVAPALLQINSAVNFAANTTIDMRANNVLVREAEFNGRLTSAGSAIVTFTTTGAPNTISLLQGTNYGFLGTLAVTGSAQVHTTGANTLARTASVSTSGDQSSYIVGRLATTGLSATGANVQLGAVSGTGQFALGDINTTSSALVGFRNGTDTVSGGGTIAVANANSHLGKVGTGEWRFSGTTSSTVNGTFSVRDGLVNFSSGSGSAGGFGTASTGNIQIYSGGELRVTTSGAGVNGRIGNTQPVTLQGGILRLDNAASAASAAGFSETAGALTVGAGQSTVRVDTSAVRGTRFNFASLTNPSSSTGSVVFLSNSLGVEVLDTVGSGNVFFASAPNAQLVGTTTTYGENTTNLAILPYATGGTVTAGAGTTFVTYDSTNASIRGLADTNYVGTLGTADANVSLSTPATVSTATIANALRITAGGSVSNTSTLTIASGALLNNGGGGVNGGGTLAFGTGGNRTAFITVTAAGTGSFDINNAVSATNLSKNGAGTLVLNGTTTLTGTAGHTVAVNAGTLQLNGGPVTTTSALSASNPLTYQVSRGAALNVTAGGLTVGNFTTLTGGASTAADATQNVNRARVVGNVTVNSGGTIAPSALGGPQTSLASPGTLTVVGDVALNGGSNYVWTVNSAVTSGDNTVAPTAGTLNNFKSPYTASLLSITGTLDLSNATSGNRINLRLTSLALSNESGPVYDLFDGTNRSWVLIEAGSINGFAADKFTFDVSAFQNVSADQLSVSQVGNSLVLTFSPVPEPAAMLAVAAAVTAGGVAWRRFRRRPVAVPPTTAI